jgi:hypothetical protein
VTMRAVWAPVQPATRWMRVVSRASASVMAGRVVVNRRARLDDLASGAFSLTTGLTAPYALRRSAA